MELSLAEMQALFSRSIRGDIEPRLLEAIEPGGTLSAREALDVHRDGYVARLTEALGETFEACWWVLGDEMFFETCEEFIRGTPSRSPNLSDYHPDFPAFLEKKWSREAPFIGELALYEWTFKNLFHRRADGLGPEAFAEMGDLSRAVLEFSESVALFSFRYSVYGVWKQRNQDQETAELNWEEPEKLLLYRREGETYVYPLNETEYFLLSELRSGEPLGRALENASRAAQDDPDFPDPDEQLVNNLFGLLAANRIIRAARALPENPS